jgi:hypothetical protein
MNPTPFDSRPTSTTGGVFVNLLRLPPRPRVIAGILSIAGGVLVSVLLWDRGVLWGLPIFAFIGGLFMFFSGLTGIRKQKERQKLLASFESRRTDLLDGMVAEKREGRNPIRWLNDQGIQDLELRSLLIEGMNDRLKQPRGK